LLDGNDTNGEDWNGEIALAPDGSSCAMWTQPGAKLDGDGAYAQGAQVLVTPWKKGAKWEDADALNAPRFAPDGSFVTALASKGGAWRLVIADKKGERELGKPQPMITDYDVTADGQQFALVVLAEKGDDANGMPSLPDPNGDNTVIVTSEKTYGHGVDEASSPRISPDGKHVAWILRKGTKRGVAVDGGEGEAKYDWVKGLTYRPDAKELSFAAGTGGKANSALSDPEGGQAVDGATWKIVRRGDSGKETALDGEFDRVANLTWSGDGALLAFAGHGADGWHIVCGSARSEPYDEVGPPRFSADGKQIAFGARSKRELWWKVLSLEK
jgi:Tol biopolymer transport system component